MAMNINDVLTYMPVVCISILLVVSIAAEILCRKGILPTLGTAGRGPAGGYTYATYDRAGATYRFRICGSPRSGYQAYLEDAPAHINTASLRVDVGGRRYVPVRAATATEAEQEADRFVQQQ